MSKRVAVADRERQGTRTNTKIRVGPDSLQVRAFVAEYLRSFNASKAALAAGYSQRNAGHAGWALMRDPAVEQALAEASLDAQADVQVRTADVLRGLMEIANANIADVLRAGASSKHGRFSMSYQAFLELPEAVQRTVASVKVTQKNLVAGDRINDDVIEFKLWNRLQALEILAKHKGLLKEVVEHQVVVKELERLPDEELGAKHRELVTQWEAHVEARKKLRGGLKALRAAETVAKKAGAK